MDNISKLAHLLASAPKTIELIPGSGEEWLESYPDNIHAPFLFVEGNLGVPEKVLYKTYVAAVTVLGNPRMYRQKLRFNEDADRRQALDLTSVILLANPGHQTALNIRKTIIFCLQSLDELDAIPSELNFTDALLSAKECAKVSMLWHHRRVLLMYLYPSTSIKERVSIEYDKYNAMPLHTDDYFATKVDLPVSALQTEFNLVRHACELYPRNYFAWYHRTLCLKSFLAPRYAIIPDVSQATSLNAAVARRDSDPGSLVNPLMTDLKNVLLSELEDINLWISRHVSDYSAMEYVCRVVDALDEFFPNIPPPGVDAIPGDINVGMAYAIYCIRNALNLVEAFPSHEALWLYLRRNLLMLKARESDSNSRMAIITIRNEMVTKSDVLARNVLVSARQRCEAKSDTSTDNEAHTTSRHPLRFLLWLGELYSEKTANEKAQKDFNCLTLACGHFRGAFSKAAESESTALLLRTISSIE